MLSASSRVWFVPRMGGNAVGAVGFDAAGLKRKEIQSWNNRSTVQLDFEENVGELFWSLKSWF